jgi:hypothetical protein
MELWLCPSLFLALVLGRQLENRACTKKGTQTGLLGCNTFSACSCPRRHPLLPAGLLTRASALMQESDMPADLRALAAAGPGQEGQEQLPGEPLQAPAPAELVGWVAAAEVTPKAVHEPQPVAPGRSSPFGAAARGWGPAGVGLG